MVNCEGYKILKAWQDDVSQQLKESALTLDDIYMEVTMGTNKHVKKVSIKDQIHELQGRQNQMINERKFLRDAAAKFGKISGEKENQS